MYLDSQTLYCLVLGALPHGNTGKHLFSGWSVLVGGEPKKNRKFVLFCFRLISKLALVPLSREMRHSNKAEISFSFSFFTRWKVIQKKENNPVPPNAVFVFVLVFFSYRLAWIPVVPHVLFTSGHGMGLKFLFGWVFRISRFASTHPSAGNFLISLRASVGQTVFK